MARRRRQPVSFSAKGGLIDVTACTSRTIAHRSNGSFRQRLSARPDDLIAVSTSEPGDLVVQSVALCKRHHQPRADMLHESSANDRARAKCDDTNSFIPCCRCLGSIIPVDGHGLVGCDRRRATSRPRAGPRPQGPRRPFGSSTRLSRTRDGIRRTIIHEIQHVADMSEHVEPDADKRKKGGGPRRTSGGRQRA